MIVTPLVGSLVLFWMVDAEGIIGANLQILMNDPYLSVKSSKTLTWITIIIYGIWPVSYTHLTLPTKRIV